MSSEIAEQKAKILFISILVFFIVLLIGISYFVYVDKSNDNDENNNTEINNIKREISNLNKLIPSNVQKVIVNDDSNTDNAYTDDMENNETYRDESNQYDNIADSSMNTNRKKQVFNISNNIFNYDEARQFAQHGAKLATYQQVVDSYKNGGEWCNYGWSENQMALYPTQKETYNRLQRDPENANICGEWGVNGGYFENPNTLFGANWYGVNPDPKDRERSKSLPASGKERQMMNKVKQYKEQLNDFNVSSFNKNLWSKNKYIE